MTTTTALVGSEETTTTTSPTASTPAADGPRAGRADGARSPPSTSGGSSRSTTLPRTGRRGRYCAGNGCMTPTCRSGAPPSPPARWMTRRGGAGPPDHAVGPDRRVGAAGRPAGGTEAARKDEVIADRDAALQVLGKVSRSWRRSRRGTRDDPQHTAGLASRHRRRPHPAHRRWHGLRAGRPVPNTHHRQAHPKPKVFGPHPKPKHPAELSAASASRSWRC